jgi:hypothetical protein
MLKRAELLKNGIDNEEKSHLRNLPPCSRADRVKGICYNPSGHSRHQTRNKGLHWLFKPLAVVSVLRSPLTEPPFSGISNILVPCSSILWLAYLNVRLGSTRLDGSGSSLTGLFFMWMWLMDVLGERISTLCYYYLGYWSDSLCR